MNQPPKPFLEQRPWGQELWVSDGAPSMVKILTINPGEALSLQYHNQREEFWHVLSGNGTAQIGENTEELVAGSDHFVPVNTKHRLIGGTETLEILELAFGKFDEKDIVRLEDRYGRVVAPPTT